MFAIRIFARLTSVPLRALAALAGLSIVVGAANAGMLAAVSEVLRGNPALSPAAAAAAFVLLVVASLALQHHAQVRTGRWSEQVSADLRLRVLERVFDAPLPDLERLERHAARQVLSRDVVQVAHMLQALSAQLGSLATVACAMAYMVGQSPVVAALVCAVIGLSVAWYQARTGRTQAMLRDALAANDRSFGFVDDLFAGGRDLQLDREWARAFFRRDLAPSVREAARRMAEVRVRQQTLNMIGMAGFFTLLGLLAFVLPALGLAPAGLLHALLILLFVQAHVLGIVQRLPVLQDAAQSALRIEQLLASLDRPPAGADEAALPSPFGDWRTLRLAGVGYAYDPAAAPRRLQLHDVDLEIERGSTVFVVGGNGSGKTTLAKLLTGLYAPTTGTVSVDGKPVGPDTQAAYRALFNAVFSDVHLFRRPRDGALRDPHHPVHRSLQAMAVGLAFDAEDRLDTRPYSQGQRKRVASALALLSDRPVCLFDEWTADQDPEFRAYFYNDYLPALKQAGKTVVVITHDERWFQLADQLVTMDGGSVRACVHQRPRPQLVSGSSRQPRV